MRLWIPMLVVSTLLLSACTSNSTAPGASTSVATDSGAVAKEAESAYAVIDMAIPHRDAEYAAVCKQNELKMDTAFAQDIIKNKYFRTKGNELQASQCESWFLSLRVTFQDDLCKPEDIGLVAQGYQEFIEQSKLQKQCPHLVAELQALQNDCRKRTNLPSDIEPFLEVLADRVARINLFISANVNDNEIPVGPELKALNRTLLDCFNAAKLGAANAELLQSVNAASTAVAQMPAIDKFSLGNLYMAEQTLKTLKARVERELAAQPAASPTASPSSSPASRHK